jgi:hypothetical protein
MAYSKMKRHGPFGQARTRSTTSMTGWMKANPQPNWRRQGVTRARYENRSRPAYARRVLSIPNQELKPVRT